MRPISSALPLIVSACCVAVVGCVVCSQWLVSRFSVWHNELSFIDALLDADMRNNSAWNHRYFVHDKQRLWDEGTLQTEVESVQ